MRTAVVIVVAALLVAAVVVAVVRRRWAAGAAPRGSTTSAGGDRLGCRMLGRAAFVERWARDEGPPDVPYGTAVANREYGAVPAEVIAFGEAHGFHAPRDTEHTLVCDECERVHGLSFLMTLSGMLTAGASGHHGSGCRHCGCPRSLLLRGVQTVDAGGSTIVVVEGPGGGRPRHAGARAAIESHLERLGREMPRLAPVPGCRRLGDADVLAFVLDAATDDPPGPAERVPAAIGRFEEVDVVVSAVEATDPAAIRALLPDGYVGYLDALVRRYGLRLGQRDVAHWVLGRDPGTGAYAVHLTYLPVDRAATRLLPTDLLSDADRRGVF